MLEYRNFTFHTEDYSAYQNDDIIQVPVSALIEIDETIEELSPIKDEAQELSGRVEELEEEAEELQTIIKEYRELLTRSLELVDLTTETKKPKEVLDINIDRDLRNFIFDVKELVEFDDELVYKNLRQKLKEK